MRRLGYGASRYTYPLSAPNSMAFSRCRHPVCVYWLHRILSNVCTFWPQIEKIMKIDRQVAEDAFRGDARALDLLLVSMQPDLKRFARRTCATTEDAEDAVQEALWKLHRKFSTIEKLSALAAWLFRIIERECYRLFAKPRKTAELTPEQEEHLQAPSSPLHLRSDLVAALEGLAPHYREILILRDIEELSAPETAAHLNISIAAVKSRLHRARNLMREQLIAGGYRLDEF